MGFWCFPMGPILFIVCIVQTDVFLGRPAGHFPFLVLPFCFMMSKQRGRVYELLIDSIKRE